MRRDPRVKGEQHRPEEFSQRHREETLSCHSNPSYLKFQTAFNSRISSSYCSETCSTRQVLFATLFFLSEASLKSFCKCQLPECRCVKLSPNRSESLETRLSQQNCEESADFIFLNLEDVSCRFALDIFTVAKRYWASSRTCPSGSRSQARPLVLSRGPGRVLSGRFYACHDLEA